MNLGEPMSHTPEGPFFFGFTLQLSILLCGAASHIEFLIAGWKVVLMKKGTPLLETKKVNFAEKICFLTLYRKGGPTSKYVYILYKLSIMFKMIIL